MTIQGNLCKIFLITTCTKETVKPQIYMKETTARKYLSTLICWTERRTTNVKNEENSQ